MIFFGVATPVEAAGIGTSGALIVCAMHRRLTWDTIREASLATLKATAMVMWIFFGATLFVGFFILKGGQTYVANQILGTGLQAYGIILLMMVILFILGMFIDWVGILLLTVPIFLPILKAVSFGGLLGLPGVKPAGRAAVVRRHLHGQHADGLPVAAVRLFAVLPQECRAAASDDGDDHPRRGAVPLPAGSGRHPVHPLSRDRAMAAKASLRGRRLTSRCLT